MKYLVRVMSIILVSAYLLLVLGYLLITRRIRPSVSLWGVLRARFRRPYSGPLASIRPELGHCYVAPLPPNLISDKNGHSHLVVLEDNKPLDVAHASHDEIREKGQGRFSHWGDCLYFSTRDNSDPTTNGRSYLVQERR